MQPKALRFFGTTGLWVVLLLAALVVASPADAKKPPPDDGGDGTPANPRIVYILGEDDGFDLMVMDEDGGNPTKVIDIPGPKAAWPPSPTWSPDGSQIAFDAYDSNQRWALYVVNADGTGLSQVLAGDTFSSVHEPRWSPADTAEGGPKIAFHAVTEHAFQVWSYDVWTIDPDGQNLRNLTGLGLGGDVWFSSLAWSPDAGHLALACGSADGPRIRLLHLTAVEGILCVDETTDFAVGTYIDGLTHVHEIDWHPFGSSLVLSGYPGAADHSDLWTFDLSGGSPAVTRITSTATMSEASPVWSADGSKIALRVGGSGRDGKLTGIGTIRPDGTGFAKLIGTRTYSPAWKRAP